MVVEVTIYTIYTRWHQYRPFFRLSHTYWQHNSLTDDRLCSCWRNIALMVADITTYSCKQLPDIKISALSSPICAHTRWCHYRLSHSRQGCLRFLTPAAGDLMVKNLANIHTYLLTLLQAFQRLLTLPTASLMQRHYILPDSRKCYQFYLYIFPEISTGPLTIAVTSTYTGTHLLM